MIQVLVAVTPTNARNEPPPQHPNHSQTGEDHCEHPDGLESIFALLVCVDADAWTAIRRRQTRYSSKGCIEEE